jgi:putative lipase involved disintegration of autophagic bodies
MYSLLPAAIQGLLNLLLWTTDSNRPDATPPLRFQLRHEHAVSNASRVVLSDIVTSFSPEIYEVNTRHVISHRPSSVSAYSSARFHSLKHAQSDALLWKEKDVVGPHVRDRGTLLTLAKMTSNAYNQPGDKAWYELGPWNSVSHVAVFIRYI